jgi:predicted MFS family arabinose efflux permease
MNFWPFNVHPRWRVVIFLTVAYALNYADRAALSSVLPALRAEFQLTDAQLGLLGSTFLWSYAIASPIAGTLADRYSRRRLVFASLMLWSLVTLLTGLTTGVAALLVLRVALGLTESLYIPAAIALTADHHGVTTRAKAISTLIVGLNSGVVLGGVGAGFLADHFGWRSGFWTLGLAGMAFGMIFSPLLADAPVPVIVPTDRPKPAEALRYLLRTPSYHVMMLKAALAGIATWIFLSWLPLYFQENYHLSLAAAGFMGTVMLQGTSVFGTMVGGWVSDSAAARATRRRMLMHGHGYLVCAPFLLIFLAQPSLAMAVTGVGAFSFFRGIGGANEQPVICDVVPARLRSSAVGFMNAFSTAVGGTGVFVAGLLKQTLGLNAVFGFLSVMFVIAAAALYLGYRFWAERDIARADLYDSQHAAAQAAPVAASQVKNSI